MFCPSCGREIPDDSQFCQHCGAELTIGNGDDDSNQEKSGFSFLHGLAGLIGGIAVTIFGALWFGSTQYVFPTQAAIAMWFAVIGIGITILAPAWYWLIRPISGGFNGVNPVRAIQSSTGNYTKKQKAAGYILGGIILLIGSENLLRSTADAVVNRAIPPYSIILPLIIVLFSLVIIVIGAAHGISVLRDSN